MGIDGLWKVSTSGSRPYERFASATLIPSSQLLGGAVVNESLRTLSIREGFEARSERLLRVGVDASIWIQQVQQVFLKGHAQAGENPELRTLFYRLAMLAERPIHLVFVFDGPLRPPIKRKKQVKVAPHWLMEGMQRFIDAFGYAWLEAAGEAEAELAQMNKLGIIDVVLTEDSDALVFGAHTVVRNYKRTDPDVVAVYRATSILRDEGLSVGDLVLLALLLGSDYDPSGLRHCGPRIARGLARYGLGRSLYAALCSSSNEELANFLPRWRTTLREKLRFDPNHFIGRQCPALAASIPQNFPDVSIARLFISPAVLDPARYADLAAPRAMDLSCLGKLCELYFTWGNHAEILNTFRTSVWPGEAVRMLIMEGLKDRRRGEVSDHAKMRSYSDIFVGAATPERGCSLSRRAGCERIHTVSCPAG
ncbi:PIN domain-like protein [Cubamyces sp. BRFM 1775]|nr:PIN domain-like protein [Cubamyces sp. BRFM 1775]